MSGVLRVGGERSSKATGGDRVDRMECLTGALLLQRVLLLLERLLRVMWGNCSAISLAESSLSLSAGIHDGFAARGNTPLSPRSRRNP